MRNWLAFSILKDGLQSKFIISTAQTNPTVSCLWSTITWVFYSEFSLQVFNYHSLLPCIWAPCLNQCKASEVTVPVLGIKLKVWQLLLSHSQEAAATCKGWPWNHYGERKSKKFPRSYLWSTASTKFLTGPVSSVHPGILATAGPQFLSIMLIIK